MSNFIFEEKNTTAPEPVDDDGLRYDTADTRPQAPAKKKNWSAEDLVRSLKKSDESWGVEGEPLEKAGPFIGPKGGKWADAAHTIPWKEGFHKPAAEQPAWAKPKSKDEIQRVKKDFPVGTKVVSVTDTGMSGTVTKVEGTIVHAVRDDGVAFRMSASGLRVTGKSEKTEKSMTSISELEEHLEKAHKYVKRTGAPGSYKYEYAAPGGKTVSVPSRGVATYKEGTRVSYQGQSGTVKRTKGDLTMVEFDGSGTTAEGILTERLKPEVSWAPGKEGGELGQESKNKKTQKSMTGLDSLEEHLSKALPSEEAKISPEKARQILHDGEVGGKPLTEQQRKFFGAIGGHLPAPKGKKKEKSMTGIDDLGEHLEKAGPYIGPKGGKWADAKHTIPWRTGGSKAHQGRVAAYVKQLRQKFPDWDADAIQENAEIAVKKDNQRKRDVQSKKRLTGKKTEKSMTSALKTLSDSLESDEPMSKGIIGGYGMGWADRLAGSPFETDALQCLKDLNGVQQERDEVYKKHGKPWRERDRMDPVELAKLDKKRGEEQKKCDVKEDAVRKRMSEIEKKYLDWRIEQSKMEKSEIPTGQPTNVSGGPENGGPLDAKGKPAGSGHAPNPDADQDADGNPKDVPACQTQDWSQEEDARRVFGGIGGTMKSMGSLDKDKAIAERQLRKGIEDVHPYRTSQIHGDSEARISGLSKGGANELNPRNAIISQDVLCKSCNASHPAMLTACPKCGDGTIGREMLSKSNPGVILEKPHGAPILKQPKPEEDITIK